MKLERLDLTAFGNFSDTTLDFCQNGKSFQVVLGPNAAGKSMALRAIINLLFGIPERTTDDFLHPGVRLRIGATIRSAEGRSLAVVRRKGRKDTLLDQDGKPIPEAKLQSFLGSVNEAQFESMFGLGHERLRQGAEDLLQAGGALGESLFEAAGGTRSVRVVLAPLQEAASALFRPRAPTARINAHVSAYEAARRRVRDASLAAERFRALEDELEALGGKIREQQTELTRLDAECRKLERIQRNLPRAARRAQLLRDIEALTGVPHLPQNASEERVNLTGKQRQLTSDLASDEADIQRIEKDLAGLEVSEALLAEAESIRKLSEHLGAVRKAADDIPNLRRQLASLRDEIDRTLCQVRSGLTIDEAESLRPPKPQARRIRELALQHAELRPAFKATEQAVETATVELQTAEKNLAETSMPRDTGALTDAIQAVHAEGNLEKQRNESAEKCRALLERAELASAALAGWNGRPLEELETVAVPLSETVQKYAADLNAADQEIVRARDRVGQRQQELHEIAADLGRLRASGDVPTPEQLTDARKHREHGWHLIRQGYIDGHDDLAAAAAEYDHTQPLPEAYEASVGAADALADRMRTDAERVAKHETLRQRQTIAQARLEEESESLERAEQDRTSVDGSWRALWLPLGIAPLTPAEMSSWLEALRHIRETLEIAREEQRRHDRFVQSIHHCRNLLRDALRFIGEAPPNGDVQLSLLIAHCERCVKETGQAEQHRKALVRSVAEHQGRLSTAEQNRAAASRQLNEWTQQWAAAVAPLGHDSTVSPTEVDELLNLLEDAFSRRESARDLERRIRRMTEDSDEFARKVANLTASVGLDLADLPADRALAEITERHQQADRNQVSRKEKRDQLASLRRRLEDNRRELAAVEVRVAQLLKRASCTSVEQLELVETQAACKDGLQQKLGELDAQLIADGTGLTLDQILQETRDHDGDRVAAAISDLQRAIRSLQEARDGNLQRHGQTQKDREDMSSHTNVAALAAQEAQEEIAAIRSDAEEYVRLRLAEIVLQEFVERYRERHQDPILKRTSELFPILTLGTFTAVRADYDEKDHPVLVGINSSGSTLGIQAMSDGTRDQLYLALRLAAVEQYIAGAESLPFIADDLLVHFDDDRARAALRVLAEFSQKAQVLFFTHHRHLVELAEQVVPTEVLGVQRLPGITVA